MPVWGQGGAELFFVDATHELMRVSVTYTGGTVAAGAPERFFAEPVLEHGVVPRAGRADV